MLHRVLVGSMERFVGGLIEHFAGAFPLWLAPEQVRVLPISEQWVGSARELARRLQESGIRAAIEERDTLSYRIRDAELHKVPYMAVVGKRRRPRAPWPCGGGERKKSSRSWRGTTSWPDSWRRWRPSDWTDPRRSLRHG